MILPQKLPSSVLFAQWIVPSQNTSIYSHFVELPHCAIFGGQLPGFKPKSKYNKY